MGDKSSHSIGTANLSNHPSMQQLRILVERWLSDHKAKQSTLADECGFDPADLPHFLTGERPLPLYALANLASKLQIDPTHLLLFGEYCQCVRRLREASAPGESSVPRGGSLKKRDGWKQAEQTFEALLQRFPGDEHTATPAIGPRTLRNWPQPFIPLMVFVGDRREMPPQSLADMLATSASMGDLFYLPKLRLHPETEIRSDKTVIIATEETVRSLVHDKNLLIIGSPAANMMARVVNSGACFSFHANPEAIRQASDFQKLLHQNRYLPDELQRFAGVNSSTPSQIEWSRRRRHMIYGFARGGILDPVDYEGLRGTTTPAYKDYGVITLCRHPWSDNCVAILAAGLHGPGTAAAIKLLSQPEVFVSRPLGGVFHVHVPIDAPWEDRYHHLNPEFETHEYTIESYASAVTKFVDTHPSELKSEFAFWDPSAVCRLLQVLQVPSDHS